MSTQVGRPHIYVCGLVAYDGTDYHGFQLQLGVPTVQGMLEAALTAFLNIPARITGAGRTDTGVHANGQVISVKLPWNHSVTDLQRAWNAHLPSSIAVRQLQLAPEEFHPRFSAIARTYRYTIYQADRAGNHSVPRRSPLTDRFAFYETRVLDLEALCQASVHLVGEHDFATFGQPTEGGSTVRRLYQADWQIVEANLPVLSEYPGKRFVFTVSANGFLRQMVRNLVGTLLEVGLGNWEPEDVRLALMAKERSRCASPVPAQGLVLESVAYPKHLGLFLN